MSGFREGAYHLRGPTDGEYFEEEPEDGDGRVRPLLPWCHPRRNRLHPVYMVVDDRNAPALPRHDWQVCADQ